MRQNPYQHQDPYPLPQGLEKNPQYARILLSAYSGRESELTAVAQYIYHHMEAGTRYDQASACLRGIAVVEMHHLDLLGSCIRQLGIHPKYRSLGRGGARYWHSGFVDYGCHLRDMLESDLRGEYQAIEKYKGIIRRIPDPQIQALIGRIIRDEELHIQALNNLLPTV